VVKFEVQGDSLRRGPELTVINDEIMYLWKRNLASICLDRCVDNWVTEDAEVVFPPPGDTGRHDATHSRMSQPERHAGPHTLKEMARTGQVGTGSLLIGVIFVCKLSHHL
jgi:hypothetical protein